MNNPLLARVGRNGATIAIGALGGYLFFLATVPLAWMLGAMCVTTAFALFGVRLELAGHLRSVMVVVLGLMLGAAFTPDMVDRLVSWASGAAVLLVFVPTALASVYFYLNRFMRIDPVTAYFAASPGGFGEMVLLGESQGGDVRTIALVHATRVLIVVMVIPLAYRFALDLDAPNVVAVAGKPPALKDLAILGACALTGWPLARILRFPAPPLLGTMMLSAAVHFFGWTEVRPPGQLIAMAQVVIGASVGARFVGVHWRTVLKTLLVACGSTVILLIIAVLFTGLAPVIGIEPMALNLSLAPGGLAEMSLIALALGIDTAFVSTMHVWRIVMIYLFAPVCFRFVGRHRRDED